MALNLINGIIFTFLQLLLLNFNCFNTELDPTFKCDYNVLQFKLINKRFT